MNVKLSGIAAVCLFGTLGWGVYASAPLGKVVSVVPRERDVVVNSEKGNIRIIPVTKDIFRIETSSADNDLPFKPSPMTSSVADDPGYQIVVTIGGITVQSPTTEIFIDRETSQLSFYDSEGHLLIEEAGNVNNGSGCRRASFTSIESDENLFGTGERGHAVVLNGDSLTMYNKQNYGYTGSEERISQMNINVPYFLSDYGYGVLFDDYGKAALVLGDTVSFESQSPDPLAYYFLNGRGTIAGTTDCYTTLTGRQPLPPFWSLGYITSKYGYHNEKETLGAVDSLKNAGYPVDGIVLDLYWYGKETDMGRFAWNKEQFPNPEKMLSTLRDKGVKTVVISQPYLNKTGAIDNYNELSARGMLVKNAEGRTHDVTTWVGDAGMLDVSNPETAAWMWNKYKSLVNQGVEGMWGDLGEPEVHPSGMVHANGLTTEQYHNLYGNDWSRIIYDGFKKEFPDKRLLLMMRGGTGGLQRYGVMPWSTDVSRSWGGLEPQVRIMLNAGLSGLGYMSSDIGGFAVDPKHPTDDELYVRWLQMGTFSPVLRTHAQKDPEPYHYPRYASILKKFIRERYRWLPYNYTLAYENATTGAPLVRPLNFRGENPDRKYAEISDEYMWGDEVLVAPVMKKGVTSRKVVFPSGTWINWNNPRLSYKGGTTATVKAPLDQLPMFVRKGSFIPLFDKEIENTEQYDSRFLTVKYFPSEDETRYTLFNDDRSNPRSIEEGAYQLIHFSGYETPDHIAVSVESNGGRYNGMPAGTEISFEIENVKKAPAYVETSISENLNKLAANACGYGWKYFPAQQKVVVNIYWEYEPLTLHVHF